MMASSCQHETRYQPENVTSLEECLHQIGLESMLYFLFVDVEGFTPLGTVPPLGRRSKKPD